MSAGMPPRRAVPGFFLDHDRILGTPKATRVVGPDTSAGDAQFFVPDPRQPVQLRPVLASEALPGRPNRPHEWVLVSLNSVPQFRAFVQLPPHLRKNNRAGVMAAIRRLEPDHPEVAAFFRSALKVPRHVLAPGTMPLMVETYGPPTPKHLRDW